jgi:ATP-dependent DNA helicase RecG
MNAVMYRDYESNTPTRFYEFENRLEIMNPGGLYGNANPENFPTVNSYRNPVIAEAMKVLGYVNRFSRGIVRVQEELLENGNSKATFDFSKRTVFEVIVTNSVQHESIVREDLGAYIHQVAPQVTPQVLRLLKVIKEDSSRNELQEKLGLKDKKNFNERYLNPSLAKHLIERTIPETPNSPLQKYRITRDGMAVLKAISAV